MPNKYLVVRLPQEQPAPQGYQEVRNQRITRSGLVTYVKQINNVSQPEMDELTALFGSISTTGEAGITIIDAELSDLLGGLTMGGSKRRKSRKTRRSRKH